METSQGARRPFRLRAGRNRGRVDALRDRRSRSLPHRPLASRFRQWLQLEPEADPIRLCQLPPDSQDPIRLVPNVRRSNPVPRASMEMREKLNKVPQVDVL